MCDHLLDVITSSSENPVEPITAISKLYLSKQHAHIPAFAPLADTTAVFITLYVQ